MKLRKRRNPLSKQDYTVLKILRRIVLAVFLLYDILAICMLIVEIVLHISGKLDTKYPPPLWLDFLGLIVLIFLCWIFSWAFWPRHWDSMQGMKGTVPYKQLKQLLADQEFAPTKLSSLSQSEHWLKVQGSFVPKNFVMGVFAYASQSHGASNYHIMLVLLNGNKVRYTVGYQKKIDPAVNELKLLLPNTDTSCLIENWIYSKGMTKKLKADFIAYIQEHPLEPLVDTWSDYAKSCMTEFGEWKESFIVEQKALWKDEWQAEWED